MGMLNVRLDEDLEKRLASEVKRRGLRRSDVVRRILDETLPPEAQELTPQERIARIRHLIGAVDSDIPNLGTNHEDHLRRIFDAKRDHTMGHRSAGSAD